MTRSRPQALFLVVIAVCMPLKAAAEVKAPEYEGVYVLTSKDEVIPLISRDGAPCDVMISDQTYDVLSGKGRLQFFYAPIDMVAHLPVIAADKIKGVYVVSRDELFGGVGYLAPLGPYLSGRPILTGAYGNGCRSGDLGDTASYIALSGAGLSKSAFRTKFVNDFTVFVELMTPASLMSMNTGTISPTDKFTIKAFGGYVVTNKHRYPFIPRIALALFLSDYQSSFRQSQEKGEAIKVPSNISLLTSVLESSLSKEDGYVFEWEVLAEGYNLAGNKVKAIEVYKEKVIPKIRASGNIDNLKKAEEKLKAFGTGQGN